MSISQTVRSATRIGILGLLITCLWYLSSRSLSQQAQNTAKNLTPIEVTQLPANDGVIPVTLQCQTVAFPNSPEMKALRCVVTNNANALISAVSLAYGITYEANGQESTDDGFMTLDSLIHPDFHDSNFSKFVQPGSECVIQRGGPVEQANNYAKHIKVRIDYVEFENGTSLGPNTKGSRLIAQIRGGAAKYKEWLKGKYLNNGKSVSAIASLLETSSTATELKLDDNMMIVGAEAYRKKAREVLNIRGGSSEIEKHLTDGGSSKQPNPMR
jgi:hypothetical protein